jgi:hypothetical protein
MKLFKVIGHPLKQSERKGGDNQEFHQFACFDCEDCGLSVKKVRARSKGHTMSKEGFHRNEFELSSKDTRVQ